MMEGESLDTIRKQYGDGLPSAMPFTELSFVPADLVAQKGGWTDSFCRHERCASVGLVMGGISVFAWVVIALGILASVLGIVLSFMGIKSSRARLAKTGLVLSVVGLVAAFLYAFAAYSGKVNYNYFTSEFWEIFSGVEKGIK